MFGKGQYDDRYHKPSGKQLVKLAKTHAMALRGLALSHARNRHFAEQKRAFPLRVLNSFLQCRQVMIRRAGCLRFMDLT